MSYDLRVWGPPQHGLTYVIGGDVAEGLAHGDDSVYEVIEVASGHQCAELQGKIDPITFGELGYMLGTYYNNALIGIENNKDGGANHVLQRLGYENIYLQQNNSGEPWDKATAKLGFNMNLKTRLTLIAQARRWMEEGAVLPHSTDLLTQFETFVFTTTKFEAVSGAHDDLVMAWVIAIEMCKWQVEWGEAQQNSLNPYWQGHELNEWGEEDLDKGTGLVDKHIQQQQRKQEREDPQYESSAEAMV
jgi:hypothetical protein